MVTINKGEVMADLSANRVDGLEEGEGTTDPFPDRVGITRFFSFYVVWFVNCV